MEAEDASLLRRFTEERSQEAFATLVQRHLPLVYSPAVRQLNGDVHRASDVAQTVFVALARDARRLSRHPALAGWLHATTRHAAIDVIRSEKRRQAREREAQTMEANLFEALDWERLKPVIDDALNALPDIERHVLLARYFEARRFADIGRAFGLSEEAARKRSERALTTLRERLARQGITSTAVGLATVLEAGAVETVPTGLAGSVVAAATAVPVAAATLGFMMFTKTQAVALAAIILAGGSGLYWQHREIAELKLANRASEERLVQARERSDAALRQARAELERVRTAGPAPLMAGASANPEPVAAIRQAVTAARASVTPDPQQIAALHSRYDSFLKQRGLTPEQMDRWVSLMAEKDNVQKDLQGAMRQYDVSGNTRDLEAVRAELVGPYWKEMYALLGQDGQRAFGEYEQASYFRSYVGIFTKPLAAADESLSEAQREQLVRTIMANHTTARSGRTDLGSQSVVDWQAVLQQSAVYLTPGQQTVLARIAQEQQQSR